MNPRLEAFKSPEFLRVFGAVASLAGAAEEEAIDVSDIEPTADEAIAAIVQQARLRNPDPATRLLLLKGQTGTGKTHTLLTAVRALYRLDDIFAVVLPMVEFVSETQFDAWLTRSLLTRLSEPYLVPQGTPVPLVRLAIRMLDLVPGVVSKRLKEALADGDVTVSEVEFRGLVSGIRSRLARATRIPPAGEGTIAAILGILFGEDDAFDYLRGLPIEATLAGVRITNPNSEQCPRLRLEEVVNVISALNGAVYIAFDQLEQSKLDGWEGRLTHVISRGALLTETLPNVAVSFAVLPSLYDNIVQHIDSSIRDRIERLGAQPVRLKPLTRTEVEALLARRLALLYEQCGLTVDAAQPLYPFEDWFLDELSGQTSRYVTEYVQQYQRILATHNRMPELTDFVPTQPVPENVASFETRYAAPILEQSGTSSRTVEGQPVYDYDTQWDRFFAQHPYSPVPTDGSKQADLMEWAIKASAPEIDGITAIRTRRDCRGRAQTHVIGFDLEEGGVVVERRDVAMCNESNQGTQLADEIRSVLMGCRSSVRPILVRPRGGRFPKGGRTAGPLLDKAQTDGAIIIRQFEGPSWERMRALQNFFAQFSDQPGFVDWQRRARPLTQISSLSDVLQYPYRAPEEIAPPEKEPKKASVEQLKPRVQRKTPSGPSVFLGNEPDSQPIYWAPFETDPRLLNFGVLVTGDSGSGKTQTLRVLIDGVGEIGAPVCIFDFKNDYGDREFTSQQGLRVHDVRRHGIPFNPLFPSAADDGKAQPIEHIFTITGVLKRVFSLGDRQTALLRDAMKTAFEMQGVDPQRWVPVDTIRAPSFDDVVAILEEQKEARNSTAISLLDRVSPLFELGLFPKAREMEVPFETMLNERLVLSLFELPTDEIKAALAELIIIRLHGYLVRGEQPRRLTRLLVLDEAWRVASSRHLENLAREGRAFGVGLAIGTQYPGDLPPDLAGSLATRIFLKNQQPDHKRAVVRAVTGSASGVQAQEVHEFLERQEMFEGLIQNQQYAPFAPFKLVPYYARQQDLIDAGTGTLGP